MKKFFLYAMVASLGLAAIPAEGLAQSRPLSGSDRTFIPQRAGSRDVSTIREQQRSGDLRFRDYGDQRSIIMNSSLQYRWGAITEKEYDELSPEARELFNEANKLADVVNYDLALESLAKAAAIDTDHIGLQFFLLKAARVSAEVSYGEDSLAFYETAAEALRRLTSNSALSPEQRLRAGRESERIREGINGLRERDQNRLDTGFNFVKRINKSKVERFNESLELEDELFPHVTVESILEFEPPEQDDEESVAAIDVWTYLSAPGLQEESPRALPGEENAFGGLNQGFQGIPEFQSGPGAAGGFNPDGGFNAQPDAGGFAAQPGAGGFGNQQPPGGFGAQPGTGGFGNAGFAPPAAAGGGSRGGGSGK